METHGHAKKIFRKLRGARGLDRDELWQHALFFSKSPDERCRISIMTARLALSLQNSTARKSLHPDWRNGGRASSKQRAVGSGSDQDKFRFRFLVDQKPVALQMAFAKVFPRAGEGMIAMLGIQRFPFLKRLDNIHQLLRTQPR